MHTLIDKCKQFATMIAAAWRENIASEPPPEHVISLYADGTIHVRSIERAKFLPEHVDGVLEWMRYEMGSRMEAMAIDSLLAARRRMMEQSVVRGPWLNQDSASIAGPRTNPR